MYTHSHIRIYGGLLLLFLGYSSVDANYHYVSSRYAAPYFTHLDCKSYPPGEMDKGWLTVTPHNMPHHVNLTLYGQTQACDSCSLVKLLDLDMSKNCTISVDSRFPIQLVVTTPPNQTVLFDSSKLVPETSQFVLLYYMNSSGWPEFNLYPEYEGRDNCTRNICLAVMIFVNYGGGGYWFFDYSYWNGLTVADLVMPWFIWILGAAIAVSFRDQLQKGITRKWLVWRVIKRSLILFALGILLNGGIHAGQDYLALTQLRIAGVLQRIAFCYFVVGLLHTLFSDPTDKYRHKSWAWGRDILPYWVEWIVMLSLLVCHLFLTFLLPVHGCPRGYLGPGGLHHNSQYSNCTGGAAAVIDQWIFGNSHIYATPTSQGTFHTTKPFDREGILGTLTSIFTCFLGLQAGRILLYFKEWEKKTSRWMIWALLLGIIGAVLCLFGQNNGIIPINKNLWSVSFMAVSSSMAFVLFTICYLLTDVYNLWSGGPFHFLGMNSITIYICHLVFQRYFPISWAVYRTHTSLLAIDVWGSTVWMIVAAVMFHKKLFITV